MGYYNDLAYLICYNDYAKKEDVTNLLFELCNLSDSDKIKALNEMRIEIEDDRLEDGLCPKCGEELVCNVVGMQKEEYQGKERNVPEYAFYCETCQWTE